MIGHAGADFPLLRKQVQTLRVVEEPHFRSQQFMHISGTEVYNPKSVEGSVQLAPGPASGDGEQHTRRAAREAQLSKRGVAR
jgi:hypothetical protein